MGDSDPVATFGYVAREMSRRKIAFIFAREGKGDPYLGPMLRKEFGGVFIANQQLSFADGESMIENEEADAISWGQLYIANPDLVRRCAEAVDLNEPNPETFYGEGPEGYTDYPFLD